MELQKGAMKRMVLEVTFEELSVLLTLASDQLFRKQFIDPKMPGFKPNAAELDLCKAVVGRLRAMVAQQRVQVPGARHLPSVQHG